MDNKKIAEFLLSLRKEYGFTQKQISEICQISTQAVSKWERGDSIPDITSLERLSELYGVTINELIKGEKEEFQQPVEDDTIENNILPIKIINAIFIFSAFLFNYIQGSLNTPYFPGSEDIIFRGYYLIFNGTGGAIVITIWIVFIVLLSHLIIYILIGTSTIKDTSGLRKYLVITSSLIAVKAVICMLIPGYIFFPQLILLISSAISIYFNVDKDSMFTPKPKREEPLIDSIRDYQYKYKNDMLTDDLEVPKSEQIQITYKLTKLLYRLFVVSNLVTLLFILVYVIQILIEYYVEDITISFLFFTLVTVALLTVSVYFYKFINSKYYKDVLKYLTLPVFLVTLFMFVFFGMEYLVLTIISTMFLVLSFIISRQIKTTL